MAYVAIPDSELDPEEPILSTTIKQLRDNAKVGADFAATYSQDIANSLDGGFSSGFASFFRIGGIITLSLSNMTWSSASSISTTTSFVPSTYRPGVINKTFTLNVSGSTLTQLTVKSNGQLTVNMVNTTTGGSVSTTGLAVGSGVSYYEL